MLKHWIISKEKLLVINMLDEEYEFYNMPFSIRKEFINQSSPNSRK